ncbi:hypothetical protein GPECTOR_3g464 [Gonium pectorale]|uniref:Nucleotide-diphospho-sugar transferase domain-containing protein n=1 Tax=Gonium pectorale TaxID=33097 RepID=A0A150H025_GONPE|nr:hypothetical protein GPECTOR_3g464 [Gonium pectorale]|eukprot:KXZ55332.1 hypothetical protein GPECTOR_3g464 [Gonium pectorale]
MTTIWRFNRDNPWMLTLLQVTRLNNPGVRIFVVCDAEVFKGYPELALRLAQLRVDVRVRESYMWKDSPTVRVLRNLPSWYNHEDESLYATTRHCALYSEAVRSGVKRIVLMDADVGLFSPVWDFTSPFDEDVVSGCRHTIQFVIIKTWALGNFCAFLANYYHKNETELRADARFLGKREDEFNNFHDMEFMSLFLHYTPPSVVSRRVLCPEQPDMPVCSTTYSGCRASSQVQALESFFKVKFNQAEAQGEFTVCSNLSSFHEIVEWGSDSRGLPVPVHRRTGECFPAIHFQGDCKRFIPSFLDHYKRIVREALTAGPGDGGGGAPGSGRRRRRLASWESAFLDEE